MNRQASAPSRWRLSWKSWRFLQLLIFMVGVLLLSPLQSSYPVLTLIMQLMLLNGLMVSLSAAGFTPRMRGALYVAWLVATLLKIASQMTGDVPLAATFDVASLLVNILVILGSVIATLRYVLLNRRVTTDSISAAIVAYLLIGLAFASAYHFLFVLDGRSFTIPTEISVASSSSLHTAMIYFSFVTMATLGYGDIAPRLPLSEMLAVIEAIIGQFYIAVVIAWLMSVYAAERARTPDGSNADE
jgi:hypothetical protein